VECGQTWNIPRGETKQAFAGRKTSATGQDVIAYLKSFPE
jgi:cytochrome c2